MNATKTNEWMNVELSGKHAGQIVTPIVERRIDRPRKGKSIYTVRLSYFDASDRSTTAPESFTGNYWDCIRWLTGQGILTDDSRF